MTLELVVFDLAGTTVKDNKDVHRCLQRAMLRENISISLADANQVMGIPKPHAIRILLEEKGFQNISPEWINHIHENFMEEMIRFYSADAEVGEKEGVSETFAVLKDAGVFVVVDTGFNRMITNALLSRLDWFERGLVDASITSDEVANGRPYPDMIFRAMELAGVSEAGRVAKVGDTSFDLMEGTAAKCSWVIGITTGAFSREELMGHPYTHLINQIPEVLPIFGLDGSTRK